MSERNHETRTVALLLNSDQGTYNFVEEIIEQAKSKYDASQALKDSIREYLDSEEYDKIPGMFKDLLTGALSEVDWLSIIEDFTEE